MANRPVFVSFPDSRFCVRWNTEFEFHGGFSVAQKQRCIRSLHEAHRKLFGNRKLLEISSKSETPLGVQLSAFHLQIPLEDGGSVSVESAFQSSKVFEAGGPYTDLLHVSSAAAKKDPRIRNSGAVIGFRFQGEDFPTLPRTMFYNWLYIRALCHHPELGQQLMEYDAFTDIEFNPNKALNCQAEAAAVYVSLVKQGLLERAMGSRESFQRIVYSNWLYE